MRLRGDRKKTVYELKYDHLMTISRFDAGAIERSFTFHLRKGHKKQIALLIDYQRVTDFAHFHRHPWPGVREV